MGKGIGEAAGVEQLGQARPDRGREVIGVSATEGPRRGQRHLHQLKAAVTAGLVLMTGGRRWAEVEPEGKSGARCGGALVTGAGQIKVLLRIKEGGKEGARAGSVTEREGGTGRIRGRRRGGNLDAIGSKQDTRIETERRIHG